MIPRFMTLKESPYLAGIVLLVACVIYLLADSAQTRAAYRELAIRHAAQDTTRLTFFPRAIVVESISKEEGFIEYTITNRKLNTQSRIRAIIREGFEAVEYRMTKRDDGTIVGFAPIAIRQPEEIAPGTVAIASFMTTTDGAFVVDRLMLGFEFVDP